MSIVNLKITFVKKQKQAGGGEGHSFITEMAVFTLETDNSWEMGYSFDN